MPLPKWVHELPAHPEQGPTVRAARSGLRLSQQALAEAIGKSQQAISLLELNQRCATAKTARELSEVLGVHVPLPVVDPMFTGAGRRAARKQQRERSHLEEAQRLEAEQQAQASEQARRLRQAITPRMSFGAFVARRRRF